MFTDKSLSQKDTGDPLGQASRLRKEGTCNVGGTDRGSQTLLSGPGFPSSSLCSTPTTSAEALLRSLPRAFVGRPSLTPHANLVLPFISAHSPSHICFLSLTPTVTKGLCVSLFLLRPSPLLDPQPQRPGLQASRFRGETAALLKRAGAQLS